MDGRNNARQALVSKTQCVGRTSRARMCRGPRGIRGGGGARQVLRFIAEAAFGKPPSAVRDLFMWQGAQQIAVYAANAVVAAHNINYLHIKSLIRLARRAQNALEPWLGRVGRLAPPRLGSPPACPLRHLRYAPVPRGALTADSRPIHMSLGASNDGLQMGSSLPGLGGLQQAGPLMATLVWSGTLYIVYKSFFNVVPGSAGGGLQADQIQLARAAGRRR